MRLHAFFTTNQPVFSNKFYFVLWNCYKLKIQDMYELLHQTNVGFCFIFLTWNNSKQLYFKLASNNKWTYHEHVACVLLSYDQRRLSLM